MMVQFGQLFAVALLASAVATSFGVTPNTAVNDGGNIDYERGRFTRIDFNKAPEGFVTICIIKTPDGDFILDRPIKHYKSENSARDENESVECHDEPINEKKPSKITTPPKTTVPPVPLKIEGENAEKLLEPSNPEVAENKCEAGSQSETKPSVTPGNVDRPNIPLKAEPGPIPVKHRKMKNRDPSNPEVAENKCEAGSQSETKPTVTPANVDRPNIPHKAVPGPLPVKHRYLLNPAPVENHIKVASQNEFNVSLRPTKSPKRTNIVGANNPLVPGTFRKPARTFGAGNPSENTKVQQAVKPPQTLNHPSSSKSNRYTIQNDRTNEFLFVEVGGSADSGDVFTAPLSELEGSPGTCMYFTLGEIGSAYQITCRDFNLSLTSHSPYSTRAIFGTQVKAEQRSLPDDLGLWYMTVSPTEPTYISNKKTRDFMYASRKSWNRPRHSVVTSQNDWGTVSGSSHWLVKPVRPGVGL